MAQTSYGTITITDTTDLEWFYGTVLTHTSGTAVANITGAAVGSMYLNTQTSLAYKCTAIAANGDQTWQYVGNMASGAIEAIDIGGKNLLYDTNAPSLNPTGVGGCGLRYFSNAGTISTNGVGTEWTAISDAPISGIKYGAKHVCTQTGGQNHMLSFYQAADRIDFIPGVQYTISYWVKSSVNGAMVSIGLTGNTEWDRTTRYDYTIENVDTWEKVSVTFTYLGTSSLTAYNQQNTILYVGFQYNVVGTVWCCGYQVEEGNIATAWSEYPYTQTNDSGRNLIRNTNAIDLSSKSTRPNINGYYDDNATMYGSLEYGGGTLSATEDGKGFRLVATGNASTVIRLGTANESTSSRANGLFGLKAGETYTYSFDVKCKTSTNYTGTALTWLGVYLYGDIKGDGTPGEENTWNIEWFSYPITYYPGQIGTEKSAHVVFTFTIPTNAQRMLLSVRPSNNSASYVGVGDYIEMKNLKLEHGNKATDWSPAPEDVDMAISDAEKVATNYLAVDETGIMVAELSNSEETPSTATTKNVFIDSDSVDIRNGQTVLASFGENTFIGNSEDSRIELKPNDIIGYGNSGQELFKLSGKGEPAGNVLHYEVLYRDDWRDFPYTNESALNYKLQYKPNTNKYICLVMGPDNDWDDTYWWQVDQYGNQIAGTMVGAFRYWIQPNDQWTEQTVQTTFYAKNNMSDEILEYSISFTINKNNGTISNIKLDSQINITNHFLFEIRYFSLDNTPIFSVGSHNEITGGFSTAIGIGLQANYPNQMVLGRYNDNRENDLLEVGIGSSLEDRTNLFQLAYPSTTASYTNETTNALLNGNAEILGELAVGGKIIVGALGASTGFIKLQSDTGVISLHNSGSNAGIWDATNGQNGYWLIAHKFDNDHAYIGKHLEVPNNATIKSRTMVYEAGDQVSCNGVQCAGHLTTSKTDVVFFIPLPKPTASSLKATVSGNWTIRHADGGYILNGAALTTIGTIAAVTIYDLGVYVRVTLSTASSFANNSVICVSGSSSAKITFSAST